MPTQKEHPIIFNTEMVRAILAGSKTQSRRVIKPQPPPYCDAVKQLENGVWNFYKQADPDFHAYLKKGCPYGQVGDRLWVRETHYIGGREENDWVAYRADGGYEDNAVRWKPSIFMPRWASRITLEITEVRVERVQEITAGDCTNEGIPYEGGDYVTMKVFAKFHKLWDSLNAKRGYGWATNPWVWVISFKLMSR